MRSNGEIKWDGELIFVSQVLVGEPVGISRSPAGEWQVRYAHVDLGFIDVDHRRLERPRHPKRRAGGLVDSASPLPTSRPVQQQPQAEEA